MAGEIFLGVVVALVCLFLVKEQVDIIVYNWRVRNRFKRLTRK